jgi:hypothetical protein
MSTSTGNGKGPVADGSCSFRGMEYHEYMAMLITMVDFGNIFDEGTKRRIVGNAVMECFIQPKITPEVFLTSLRAAARSIMSTNRVPYVLLTSFSIVNTGIKRLELLDCKVEFLRQKIDFSRKFKSRSDVLSRWVKSEPHTPESYTKVQVRVTSGAAGEAAITALRSLDLIRGIMCLFTNAQMAMSFGSTRTPINTVMLGGAHTLHLETGKSAVDTFWYEPDFQVKSPCDIQNDNINVFAKNIRWCIKKIKYSNYRDSLIDAIIRYVRAFDEKDSNTTVLHAWAAMESLLCPSSNNMDKAIQRCSFLFEDREHAKQILEHLREYRNGHVHAGEGISDPKVHCYQMQFHFREVILFHLRNSDYFKDLDEANLFLDLPSDRDLLMRRIQMHKKAVKFCSGRGLDEAEIL